MSIVEYPKRSVSIKITINKEQHLQDLENIITYASRYTCYVPLWFSLTFSTNEGNTNIINCDTFLSDLRINDYVLIGKDDYAKVLSFNLTSITIDKTIDLTKNTRVVPLLYSTIQNSNSYSFITKRVGDFTLEFKELI
jgi:hypothetical protein